MALRSLVSYHAACSKNVPRSIGSIDSIRDVTDVELRHLTAMVTAVSLLHPHVLFNTSKATLSILLSGVKPVTITTLTTLRCITIFTTRHRNHKMLKDTFHYFHFHHCRHHYHHHHHHHHKVEPEQLAALRVSLEASPSSVAHTLVFVLRYNNLTEHACAVFTRITLLPHYHYTTATLLSHFHHTTITS
jgi:hypothetical protein